MCEKQTPTPKKTTSRNSRYEKKRKSETGQTKITLWVPEEFAVYFRMMAEFCCSNKSYFPFMARSASNGRMAKAVD